MRTLRILALALLTVYSSRIGSAQTPTARASEILSRDNYSRILDKVFSHEQSERGQFRYSITLRFMPSRQPEAQIVISVSNDGAARAKLFKVSGSSVWNIANAQMEKTGVADEKRIADLIQVTRQVLPLTSDEAAQFHSGLLRSLEQSIDQLEKDLQRLTKTGETEIFLDGSRYELWINQGTSEIHWSVMDQEINDSSATGRSPIAQWMNEARQFMLQRAKR